MKKGAYEKRTWLLSNPAPGATATLANGYNVPVTSCADNSRLN